MKTFTIEFKLFKPGGTKRVPTIVKGIDVAHGTVINGLVVPLGSRDHRFWEVPVDRNEKPDLVFNMDHGRHFIADCHPKPFPGDHARFLLTRTWSNTRTDRALVLINTEAGDFKGGTGGVVVVEGNAVRVGFGYRKNREGIESIQVLLDIHPGTVVRIIPGGVNGDLRVKYLLKNEGGNITVVEEKEHMGNGKPQMVGVMALPNGNGHTPTVTVTTLSPMTPTTPPPAMTVSERVPPINLDAELATRGRGRVNGFNARYARPVRT